jgi:hypothetical protein
VFSLWAHRRRQADKDPGNVVFGSIGWLFADLMFALAMAFLVATTVGQPPRKIPVAHPTTSPTPEPSRTAEPVLELKPVEMHVTVDWAGLLRDDPAAQAALARAVKANKQLAGRHAGLVLTFGGAQGGESRAIAIASHANNVLRGLGSQSWVFRQTVYNRPFLSLHRPPASLEFDIYLFKR